MNSGVRFSIPGPRVEERLTCIGTGPDMYADNKVIASSHHVRASHEGFPRTRVTDCLYPQGPVLAYLKKVDDATNNPAGGPGDGWFKIAEVGYENRESPVLAALRVMLIRLASGQRFGESTNWYAERTLNLCVSFT